MGKVNVRICSGGRCFMQGGSDLLDYEEFLDDGIARECEFETCNCLGECKKDALSRMEPPIVSVNGKLFGEMSPQKLYRAINDELAARS